MANIRWISRLLTLVLAFCGSSPAPAGAGNFFEELFGLARPHETRATQGFGGGAGRAYLARRHRDSERRRALRSVKLAARQQNKEFEHPVITEETLALAKARHPAPCCMSADQAIDLMVKDDTLRPGDAYASTEGLRVFIGSANSEHTPEDFVPLADARNIGKTARARLAALSPPDARRAASARRTAIALATPTLVVRAAPSRGGESSVTDAKGKSIRFVGGAVPQP